MMHTLNLGPSAYSTALLMQTCTQVLAKQEVYHTIICQLLKQEILDWTVINQQQVHLQV